MRTYRRRRPFTVVNADPLVRRLFAEIHRHRCCLVDLADRAGVNKNTLKDWRLRTNPRVADLAAVGAVVGLKLCWRATDGDAGDA